MKPFSASEKALIKTLPGAFFLPRTKQWGVSTDPRDRTTILSALKRMGYATTEFESVPDPSPKVSQAVGRAREGGAYPFQLEGVEFLASRNSALLADDMGLGKTLQALFSLPEGGRAIVICPSSLKLNWAKEVLKWRDDLTPIVCKGRKGDRRFRPARAGEVVIVNYDILPKFDSVGEADQAALTKTQLVIDEAHFVKNHKSQRSRKVSQLAKLTRGSWFLTGTPLMSRPLDLWGVLSAFNLAFTVFGTWRNFVSLFNGAKTRFGYDWGEARPEVAERLKRVMLRRKKAAVLPQLPKKRRIEILLPVNTTLARAAKDAFPLIREYVDELPPLRGFSELRKDLAESRIPHLVELVENYEAGNVPIIVFSDHRAPVIALGEREGWAAILGDTPSRKRQETVDSFQKGELLGLALTIGAGATGLTLTRASTMIFNDLSWTPALNAQAEDRICRIGQTSTSLSIIKLVSDCEMDIHITSLLAKKARMIETAIDGEMTVKVSASPCSASAIPQIIDETRDQRDRRIARAAISMKRDQMLDEVQGEEGAISEDLRAQILSAMEYMTLRCDGAKEKDGMGFSAADQRLKLLASSGLLLEDEELLRYALISLKKYHRQLAAEYPSLFEES